MNEVLRTSRRAFTLLELGVVVLVAGILAASVIPSVARVREARVAAAAYEIGRSMEYARASAAASGLPCGIRFDLDGDELDFVMMSPAGMESMPGALGEAEPSLDLRSDFGADLTRISLTAGSLMTGSADTSTLWFDHVGTPHLRTVAGDLVGGLSSDGSIELGSGQVVRVWAYSGLVEVQP